jgi:hypothetical protein
MEPFAIILGISMIFGAFIAAASEPKTDPPTPQTPQEIDQEAAMLRAKKRLAEAQREHELAQTDLEITRQILREQKGNGRGNRNTRAV